jgi:hypothetical protein
MAASYSTGSATGPTDLLQKLVTWLVAQGWDQNMSQAAGSGWRAHLSKGGQYVNLRSFVNEHADWAYHVATNGYGIGLYLGDGYGSGVAWNLQSGGPLYTGTTDRVGSGMRLPSGAVSAYHFFDDGADHVTVVVERTLANCVHMGWGPSLVKTGYAADYWYFYGSSPSYYSAVDSAESNPGGELTAAAPLAHSYYITSYPLPAGYVRVDASLVADRWVTVADSTSTTTAGYTGALAHSALDARGGVTRMSEIPCIGLMQQRAWQTAFAGALLLPLHLFLLRSTARWMPIGYPPTVFFCAAVGHGFVSGDVYSVGGVDYMVFPGFAVLKAA